MAAKQQKQEKPHMNQVHLAGEGLFVVGAIAGRTKRMVGAERQKELVTYKIQTPDAVFYIKDWDANEEYFQVGEAVELPVRVSTYTSCGSTRIDYTIFRPREQAF